MVPGTGAETPDDTCARFNIKHIRTHGTSVFLMVVGKGPDPEKLRGYALGVAANS